MRKKFFSLLLIFILAISMTQTVYATSISDLQKQRQEKENQKKGTQSQLDSVNDQINDLSGEKDDVDAQISELTGLRKLWPVSAFWRMKSRIHRCR